ncbi:ABC transporter ATP-binding protein [Methanopyrus kandleri]|uniref:ATPase subunit of an iron-regulated ABC-type transporter n=1 Tax=Methanopyrus kandleri (strain AV19 / DSM 6324 / JCM 9639 / NBRC 100938) TaxID=190192 RepID=Q8TW05_METKA|nr:ABC transporter ATP-binding protein [Methanopyrus kandleri]AAM02446.1 ATPase subunit of an iron-regulated ABC-type transporter [Methanopyrus kandleri AV19]
MALLEVKDLRVESEDGTEIVRGASLTVDEGEIVDLIGPNGSGKSTLAKTIVGCSGYEVVEGEVRFKGRDITDLPMYERARMGLTMSWQEPARFEGLTVGEYLSVCTDDEDWARRCLRIVGLDPEEYWDRECGENLSGGERKRVELAAVMAMRPDLVILDEPDAGLDMSSMEDLAKVIETMREEGSAVLLITHNRDLAEQVGDRAYLMMDGKIVDEGDPKDVVLKCLMCGGGLVCGAE